MSAVLSSGSSMVFVPMTGQHLVEVLNIERNSYWFPWSKRVFESCLKEGYSIWIAEDSNQIFAYGIMSVVVGKAHILNLCVHPAFRCQGIGEGMLLHLVGIAKEHEAKIIFLESRCSNTQAIHLYKKNGFSQTGCRDNYYPAEIGRENAFVFSKLLV